MLSDARNLRITTCSESAADSLSSAIESYLDKRVDARVHLQAAIENDQHCVMAHTLQGLMFAGLRKSATKAMVQQSLQKAKQGADSVTAREQGYIAALECMLDGKPDQAILCYEAILKDHPTDLLALSFAQGELFWLGDMPRAESLSASVASHWHKELAGFPAYLAIRSFDLEEIGAYQEAEIKGRESVRLQPENVWGAHAVAHVLLMQNRVNEGLRWLDELSSHWSEANQLKFHLWWHQCLFHLEQHDHQSALDIHDQWLRNPEQPLTQALPDFYLDLQNGASLLWRLESAGVDVGDRWLEMAEAVKQIYKDMTSPFTSAHIALIFQAADMQSEFDKLISCMKYFVENNESALARGYENALAVATACRHYRKGDYSTVLQSLMPRLATLGKMGGSHAQQEIFIQMMFDCARRLKRENEMNKLARELELQGFESINSRAAYQI